METIDANNLLNEIELEKKRKEMRSKQIKEASDQAEYESKMLTKYVENNSNPNPLYIVSYCIVVVLLIWLLYVYFIKPNASGEWIDDKNNMWVIKHNYIDGTLRVLINNNVLVDCNLTGNLFNCNGIVGVWDYKNMIIFVGGGNLTRILK